MEINGFKLIEPPLKGGMAEVYRGEKLNGRLCRAFKMVRPDKVRDAPKLAAQFNKEIQLLSSLHHSNIVQLLDAYTYSRPFKNRMIDVAVLEMEWLDGKDLMRYIKENSPTGLPIRELEKIAICVTDAMEYAHNQNILHLDIKPSNIFRTNDGHIKMIDFGIAKVIGENPDAVVTGLTAATATGESTFKGTMGYASPEQLVGGKLGKFSDVYSFGRTLQFLATGSDDVGAQVQNQKWSGIIAKCTQSNPYSRYQSFEEIKQSIENGEFEPAKKCDKCGATLRTGARFCDRCGAPTSSPPPPEPKKKCPKCSKMIPSDSLLCTECGYSFADIWQCGDCGKEFRRIKSMIENPKFCIYCCSKNLKPMLVISREINLCNDFYQKYK